MIKPPPKICLNYRELKLKSFLLYISNNTCKTQPHMSAPFFFFFLFCNFMIFAIDDLIFKFKRDFDISKTYLKEKKNSKTTGQAKSNGSMFEEERMESEFILRS